jgi:hypothetical protein
MIINITGDVLTADNVAVLTITGPMEVVFCNNYDDVFTLVPGIVDTDTLDQRDLEIYGQDEQAIAKALIDVFLDDPDRYVVSEAVSKLIRIFKVL